MSQRNAYHQVGLRGPQIGMRPDRPLLLLSTILPACAAQAAPLTETRLAGAYGKLPIGFEANCGQADARVNFLARGRGYTLLLTATQATLGPIGPVRSVREARPIITTITLIGGNAAAHSEGLGPLPGLFLRLRSPVCP
jgi:hypothetical protein